MSDFMVETHALSKIFKKIIAVDRIDLRIPKGSIYALLGPNGAGKTTSIRMLLGLLKPSEGEIFVNEINVSSSPREIRGKIGLLPQFSAAYYDLTPMKNIKFTLELNDIPYEEVQSKMTEYFQTLDITPELLNKPFSKLSGGEQRAICFIMAAITNKEFLILDEPTTGLDISRAKYIRSIIKDLVEKEGKTVLLSSHLVSDLEELAEYCGILKKGKLIFQGNKQEIINTYAPETSDFEDAIVEAFKTPIKEVKVPFGGI
ncbi:MAG: ABC transporter ATP-binding protein [Candidatus Heimdallarchaeota archaeon]|nr:ABC transporter ATP-binding protein [Candidatus Heimdallarchaeota archaeon]MCK4955282.1 ABC transporter ATP-binding protein [Candidatus Heimdallarchaeota archaeon]